MLKLNFEKSIFIPTGWPGLDAELNGGLLSKTVTAVLAKPGMGTSAFAIPVWEKYTLTIEEAARYFRIGEGKLRRLASEMPPPDWVVMNGNRVQVKRKAFERFIDATDVI